MLSPSLNFRDFCLAATQLPEKDILLKVSAEVSELVRNRKASGQPSEPEPGTSERRYYDDLRSLIQVLVGGPPIRDRKGFDEEVRPLLLHIARTVRIDSEFFRRVTDPTFGANPTMSELRQAGVDSLMVAVDRSDTEKGDIKSTLDVLRSVLVDRDTVRMFQGQVEIAFDGYDNDAREIYEIPEIRQFIHALDSEFPYWLYFLSTETDTLRMLAFCLCTTTKLGPGLVSVAHQDLQAFMGPHLAAMDHLFDDYKLDERIRNEIAQCLIEYFTPRQG